MKSTIEKYMEVALKKENTKRSGLTLAAIVAVVIVSVVAVSISSDDMPASQQSASSGKSLPKSSRTASKAQKQIKPLTNLKKSSFKGRIGPPTKRLAGR